MGKTLFELINLLALVAIVLLPLVRKGKALFVIIIFLQLFLGSLLALGVIVGDSIEFFYRGTAVTSVVPIRIDGLSAWFILVIGLTFFTGIWYGMHYLKRYTGERANLTLHYLSFVLVYTALIDICAVQNSFVFLVVWEIMALGTFVMVILDNHKSKTLKAGINYLIQSHIGILLLTLAFIWVKLETGSYDFNAITGFTSSLSASAGLFLFTILFMGFAIKAGFVPFHTWLPHAHPAAPAHVSGIMSGGIIKLGIYGILRMLMLVRIDMVMVGQLLLVVSVITGVYGVMLAIIQHDLKSLLAYHSIENIGIIGIGIAIGCLGIGHENPLLMATGFAGALLHTLNHSLFKSLLFYSAGNIYLARHTMNIDSLGGLLKEMPRNGYLFLIGSLAICGLPPFNGFVSEFLIYKGIISGIITSNSMSVLVILFALLGLVIIGGLALICFTKAFGIMFLGKPRGRPEPVTEDEGKSYPLILTALLILLIGLFPLLLGPTLVKVTALFGTARGVAEPYGLREAVNSSMIIGWYSLGFILLTVVIFLLRRELVAHRIVATEETWGCGYQGDNSRMSYTASSFVRTYRKLFSPLLNIHSSREGASGLYPVSMGKETYPGDKVERWLIDKPLNLSKKLLERFSFLQNGNIQAYILYGLVFITMVILLPTIYALAASFIKILNQL
ncbi:MAG: hypothetical protein GXY51_08905 [Bacteroidetes bacterium]|jgi:formate hydrogenlyase subunit 3/multisubunit Na+/H+ antiporter MnhD subunit|nr:hypothetical protein [Bacteroidota bacterium]